jgi:hypothetical protein
MKSGHVKDNQSKRMCDRIDAYFFVTFGFRLIDECSKHLFSLLAGRMRLCVLHHKRVIFLFDFVVVTIYRINQLPPTPLPNACCGHGRLSAIHVNSEHDLYLQHRPPTDPLLT